jgi:uncharacterized membrane protein YjfL (UPF0719 family)
MACVMILMGNVLGLVAAISSMVAFNTSVLSALAVWSGAGCIFVLIGLAVSMLPYRDDVIGNAQELA